MRFTRTYIKELGSSPAAVNRRTGELFLSPHFFDLPHHHQAFILWHEWGHYVRNTSSELEADASAFLSYAWEGRPLSEAVTALHDVLNMNNPAHRTRARRVFEQAIEFDNFFNPSRSKLNTQELRMGTIKEVFDAKTAHKIKLLQLGQFDQAQQVALEQLQMMPDDQKAEYWEQQRSLFADYHMQLYAGDDLEGYDDEDYYEGDDLEGYDDEELEYEGDDLEGYDDEDMEYMSKEERQQMRDDRKRQREEDRQRAKDARMTAKEDRNARRNEQSAANAEKKYAQADKTRAVGESKLTKAEAKMELAKQGISEGGELIKSLGGIAKDVGGMFGKGGAQDGMADPLGYGTPSGGGSDTAADDKKGGLPVWAWILIVIGILLVVGGGAFLLIRSRKKAAA